MSTFNIWNYQKECNWDRLLKSFESIVQASVVVNCFQKRPHSTITGRNPSGAALRWKAYSVPKLSIYSTIDMEIAMEMKTIQTIITVCPRTLVAYSMAQSWQKSIRQMSHRQSQVPFRLKWQESAKNSIPVAKSWPFWCGKGQPGYNVIMSVTVGDENLCAQTEW